MPAALPAFTALLSKHQKTFGPVLPIDLNASNVCCLNFTVQNPLLTNQAFKDTEQFDALIKQMLKNQGATVGIGGYLENRVIYRRSALFSDNQTNRCIHLGVDIWALAGTPIFVPLDAIVHSFKDNAHFGDYGPTIILEHSLENYSFYTLYGHLSRSSLSGLQMGQRLRIGQQLATIGPYPENGDWPPHLHFQVITDMLGQQGDFPGVCRLEEQAYFAEICLNPNLILQSCYLAAF